ERREVQGDPEAIPQLLSEVLAERFGCFVFVCWEHGFEARWGGGRNIRSAWEVAGPGPRSHGFRSAKPIMARESWAPRQASGDEPGSSTISSAPRMRSA